LEFKLNEGQQSFADAVRCLAHDKLADCAKQRTHSAPFPWNSAKLVAELDLMGITFNSADGGQGGTLMQAALASRNWPRVRPKTADIMQAGNFGPIRSFVEYATAEQKARFVPDLLDGPKLIALGMVSIRPQS
jgi:alkylation response protein AidB-like acyl-CoA dehydrogenase